RLSKIEGQAMLRIAAAAFLVGSSTGGSSDMPTTSLSLASAHTSGAKAVTVAMPAAAPRKWRRKKVFTYRTSVAGGSLSAAEYVPPAARRSERRGVIDAALNGTGQTIRSQRAEFAQGQWIVAQFVRAGRNGEHRVAILRRVHRAERPCQTVLRHHRHPLSRSLVELCV